LGFTLAVLAIARQPQASNVFAVMGVPTLLFMLPILDTTLVTITRLLRGQSPSRGGRDHTSHRLIAFGLTERQAVLALYVVALMSGLAGLILETIDYWLSLVLVPLIVLVFAIFAAYLGRLKVVVTEKHSEPGALSRMLVELTYRRRLLEITLDLLLISIAFYMSFLVYQGFHMSDAYLELFQRTLPLAISTAYISFFGFGVYRGVWRYVGLDDLIRFIKSIASTVTLLFLVDFIFLRGEDLPLSIYLFYAVFLFLGLSTTRSSFKILDQASSQQRSMKEERVLIYGAGDAGEMAARWILMNPELGFHTIGFIDDDLLISGRQIHGIEILGGHEISFDLLENNKVDGVVITGDAAHPKEVMELFRERGKWIRTFQLEFKLLE
jgi:UDP-GlcNAc:undecaprenyl-phosphate GlcNAc-1-phosphate transferase